jgi:hypothetical protein
VLIDHLLNLGNIPTPSGGWAKVVGFGHRDSALGNSNPKRRVGNRVEEIGIRKQEVGIRVEETGLRKQG